MSTNLQAAFDLVLATAIQNRIGQNEMPATIYIVSDMEFDYCTGRGGQTNFQAIKDKYAASGYTMPSLVFWNVNSRQDNVPVTYNTQGVALVSGYSPSLFKQVMANKTPEEVMKDVLLQERYNDIKAAE